MKKKVSREDLIKEARKYIGVKFAHQGRNPKFGIDCGGLILVTLRNLKLTQLEELGYASFPTDGRFDELLAANADDLNYESSYPHGFTGEEFRPGDILSFDYENGEGTRHIAFVTRWDGSRFWILHAQPNYGISEHPLAHPFSVAKIRAWTVRGLND